MSQITNDANRKAHYKQLNCKVCYKELTDANGVLLPRPERIQFNWGRGVAAYMGFKAFEVTGLYRPFVILVLSLMALED